MIPLIKFNKHQFQKHLKTILRASRLPRAYRPEEKDAAALGPYPYQELVWATYRQDAGKVHRKKWLTLGGRSPGGLHRGGILANSEGGRGSPAVEVETPV